MAKPYLSDQALKALAICTRGCRLTQIRIDDHNARGFPPQRNSSLTQAILTGGTLCIFQDLMQGTLPHIQHRLTCEVSCHDFLRGDLPLSTHWHTSAIMAATIVSSPDEGALGWRGLGERVVGTSGSPCTARLAIPRRTM